ncbi:surface carbohydrate biosynthesis protein [Pseudomonas sp. EA_35y_Pfl2_R5]|uniref:surface carbohydrate biosynthesis protein n=1 Tax=Pseudomonas sp. EA_35y_Pfl2_R5 TaxID=3088690 RepID=UPI0030DCBDE9
MNALKSAKPTLYLPIEIKAREFKSKVLIAVIAAESGFRVYMGTKRSIDRLVLEATEEKGGIYFYKGGKSISDLAKIKEKVDSFVVLDEEMGPAVHDLDMYCRRRIYPGTESLIDKLFVIGHEHQNKLEQARPGLAGRVFVTGWPRVDLWRSEFRGQYSCDGDEIRARYGKFILFSSDFGFLTEGRVLQEIERFQKISTSDIDVDNYKRLAWSAYNDFNDFVDFVRRIDTDERFPPLIIRPHPAEEISEWTLRLSGLKKVKIIFEGEVGIWLYAAAGLVHRGCTTAVQAHVAGIPSVYLVGDHSQPKFETLTYKVSRPASSYDELLALCVEMYKGGLSSKEVDVSDRILVDDDLACTKIVKHLEEINVQPMGAFRINPFLRFFRFAVCYLNEYREMKGWGLARDKLAKARRKMLGGIHEAEVLKAIKKLRPDFLGTVIERDFNLVEIDGCWAPVSEEKVAR